MISAIGRSKATRFLKSTHILCAAIVALSLPFKFANACVTPTSSCFDQWYLPFKGTTGSENSFSISKQVVIQIVESPSGRTSNTNRISRIEVSDDSERDIPIT